MDKIYSFIIQEQGTTEVDGGIGEGMWGQGVRRKKVGRKERAGDKACVSKIVWPDKNIWVKDSQNDKRAWRIG